MTDLASKPVQLAAQYGYEVVRSNKKGFCDSLNLSTQVFVSSFGANPITVIFAQVAVAPSAEYEATAVNIFFPLSSQMTPKGGTDPECSDAIDNDGDGLTDFPNDPGCNSPSDADENG
jgi:hypothetical protein